MNTDRPVRYISFDDCRRKALALASDCSKKENACMVNIQFPISEDIMYSKARNIHEIVSNGFEEVSLIEVNFKFLKSYEVISAVIFPFIVYLDM